ncbi:NLP/P60 protein [Caballeronia calidae]|uniref:NLP/P60 protein n=1 Tax=Caballeronia calidae TaxID=1777139 RepID=A0A158E8G8_9BURK|nr:C40 family peptidase [Caballeronia calidae]SAL03063.1 NLP/P60 protein [Caballeronia calidae]
MKDETLARVVPYVIIHANAEAPRECCGAVILKDDDLVYVACRNLAVEHEHFIIAGYDYARAADSGRVMAIAHSHPYIAPEPSLADRIGIERTGLPWLIVNVPVGSYSITRPSGFKAPLIERPFVHGVHDCYAIVRDYYALQGIELRDYPRAFGWWEDPLGPDLYRDNFEKEGFVEVPREKLRQHDLILMNIRARRDNHMAVYLGHGVILHHLIGQASRREAYQEFYQRRTTAVLRHKAFLTEPKPCSL